MYKVSSYEAVRRAVFVEELSRSQAARRFGKDPRTIKKMCAFSAPPGYRRARPPARPKLDPFLGVIDVILAADLAAPVKQRHTAKRIFERLRDEHGYKGGYTSVKDYVRGARITAREMFVPLIHPPGHAQVDFGEAVAVIAGVRQKIHFFCMDLPHSDACFVKAYPAETTEAFLDGHVAAFAFFGGVPLSILYDNLKIAVARILGDGVRVRSRAFSELVSHFLFADRFGRPGKGNDKGNVEGLVKYARKNFMVPIPHAAFPGKRCKQAEFQNARPTLLLGRAVVWGHRAATCRALGWERDCRHNRHSKAHSRYIDFHLEPIFVSRKSPHHMRRTRHDPRAELSKSAAGRSENDRGSCAFS